MKTEEERINAMLNLMDEYFQEVNSDPKERARRIKEVDKQVKKYLSYNLRLTELSEDEKRNFVESMEGETITDEMKETIKNCKTKAEKDHYYEMWARATYFRRCAWFEYLYGDTDRKPFISTRVLAV